MQVEVRECPFAELSAHPDFPDLTQAYARESGLPGMPEPCAHLDTYFTLEQAGVLASFGAFADSRLVGLALLLVAMLPHYSVVMGHVESFFVAADYRKSGAGIALRRATEREAHHRGARGVFMQAAIGSRLNEMLTKEGVYAETHHVFLRLF